VFDLALQAAMRLLVILRAVNKENGDRDEITTEAQQQLALAQYEQAIRTGFREVSDSLVEYRKVKEIHAQQEPLVTTLKDRSRLAYMRYRGGVDTLLNALDADRDLFAAEVSLARTRWDELLALVQLYKALGQ